MVGLSIAATTVTPVPQPAQSRLIVNARTTIVARNFGPNLTLGRDAPQSVADKELVRMPVGSVHQPEPEHSSRVGCRDRSRGVTAATTCWLLPCIDFGAVCRLDTKRLAGLKKIAKKNIFYIGSFQSSSRARTSSFSDNSSPSSCRAHKVGTHPFAPDQLVIQRQMAVVVTRTTRPTGSRSSGRLLRFLHRPWVNVFVSPVDFR